MHSIQRNIFLHIFKNNKQKIENGHAKCQMFTPSEIGHKLMEYKSRNIVQLFFLTNNNNNKNFFCINTILDYPGLSKKRNDSITEKNWVVLELVSKNKWIVYLIVMANIISCPFSRR